MQGATRPSARRAPALGYHAAMGVAALVLGAGRGERLGHALPKAYVELAGRPLLAHALEAVASCPEVDHLVPVIGVDDQERYEALVRALPGLRCLAPPVIGGAERQDSVRAGLAVLPETYEWVAVHDAARSLIRPEAISRVVREARDTGAAILAVPVSDTIKRVQNGRIVETPPRQECWAAQTPQVFRTEILAEALAKAAAAGRVGTDCAELVEALGVAVRIVLGDADNLKITCAEDLALAERLLAERA